jgi:transcriptional regulator with XRE-family HTH domain
LRSRGARVRLRRVVETGLHERMREAVGRRTYRALSDLTGVNAETVRRYLRGQSPSVEFVAALCAALGYNAHWVLTGQGPKRERDRSITALREAGPAELLGAIAGALETLTDRVERLESYVQGLEAGLRSRPGTAIGKGEASDGVGGASGRAGAWERARRVADAVAERPRPDAEGPSVE